MPSISPQMINCLTEYDGASNEQHERNAVKLPQDYKNKDTFLLNFNERPYEKQYASIYYNRFKQLKPRVMINAKKKWENESINNQRVVHTPKVLDIKSEQPCWVVGTIYCEMKYKPNVLQDVAKGENDSLGDSKTYTDPDLDEITLEDESGRLQLEGELLKDTMLVTGTVIGVLGMEARPGTFQVVDIVYPFVHGQKSERSSSSKIAIVSGLEFNGSADIKYELLKEFLTGELEFGHAEQISRLIIAGNSVLVNQDEGEVVEKNKYSAHHRSNYNVESVNQLDSFLHDLLPSIPVDLMPGESDPAETSLPQQPLHPAFFQKSKAYLNSDNFRTLTNPAWLQYNELKFLGTSGENINDIYKYVVPDDIQDSRLGMLEATIIWQNIIPTAPDTLWCYPFSDRDPFTLNETPHVYFVGNQPKYESKMLSLDNVNVKLISVPKFKETGVFVILDTDTLETQSIKIA